MSPVKTAARMAKIRDRIAERARAVLATHDAAVRDAQNVVEDLAERRSAVERALRPDPGQSLDTLTQTIGRFAAFNLERALQSARGDLGKKEKQRDGQRQAVRKLAIEAERAALIHDSLKRDRTAETNAKEAKAADALGTQRALRSRTRRSTLPPPA